MYCFRRMLNILNKEKQVSTRVYFERPFKVYKVILQIKKNVAKGKHKQATIFYFKFVFTI